MMERLWSFIRWRRGECLELLVFLQRHWAVALLAFAAYGVALHWIDINVTNSLPYRVVFINYGAVPQRGDLIVYRFAGTAMPRYGYLKGAHFFKRVAGMPGDEIRVEGRTVYVGDRMIGWAKKQTLTGTPLDPIPSGVIPAGFLFAQSDSTDSFDSRYAQSGLVQIANVVGVAKVIF